MRTAKIMLIVLLFASCSRYCDIEQKTRIDSYCDNTYVVETCVWVKEWYGLSVSLEYMNCTFDVPRHDLKKVKNKRLVNAVIVKNKVNACLKSTD